MQSGFRIMSHLMFSKIPPLHFLAWPETFGRTDSKSRGRSREINDFHPSLAQTPRTLFRDQNGISELREHRSSFDDDRRLEVENHARLVDGAFGTLRAARPATLASTRQVTVAVEMEVDAT